MLIKQILKVWLTLFIYFNEIILTGLGSIKDTVEEYFLESCLCIQVHSHS